MASRRFLVALVVLVAGSALVTCRRLQPAPSAEELVLQREVQKLRAQVEAAEAGTLLDFEQMLVVVDQELVQRLLTSATPLEGDVGQGFHVRIDAARAEFSNGVALVHLDGEARLVGSAISAQMRIYGGLDVVELDPASGVLRARVAVYAAEIPKADVLGIDQPARRLTQGLAEGGLETLLGPIEVPVRIEDRLRLPALRTRRISVPALDVPVAATVSSVRVFAGKLWVGVRAKVTGADGKACPSWGEG
jgi:hypothetical protein